MSAVSIRNCSAELFTVAAKHFSNAHFFGTIDCLRGGEVNEIDTCDHDQEDADERECSNQSMAEGMTVVISKAVIKMNFGQGLKDITVFRILSGLVFFRKGCQVRIKFLRRETIRQNNKCIGASVSTDPVGQVVFNIRISEGGVGDDNF